MIPTWLVLLPPLAVLIASLITKRLNLSLIIGLISAGLIAGDFAPWTAITLIGQRIISQLTDPDNLYLYGFLFFWEFSSACSNIPELPLHLPIGSPDACTAPETHKFRSFPFFSFFIDDYLKLFDYRLCDAPAHDRFHIPRASLAYLIHSILGPFSYSCSSLQLDRLHNQSIRESRHFTNNLHRNPYFRRSILYLSQINSLYLLFHNFAYQCLVYCASEHDSFGPMQPKKKLPRKRVIYLAVKRHLLLPVLPLKLRGAQCGILLFL